LYFCKVEPCKITTVA